MILLDTNILVHATTTASPRHAKAKEICRRAWQRESEACVALQNLCEWYAVVTDSRKVNPPLSAEQASRELTAYKASNSVTIIAPSVDLLQRLPGLLRHAKCKGSHVFDVLLSLRPRALIDLLQLASLLRGQAELRDVRRILPPRRRLLSRAERRRKHERTDQNANPPTGA